jgi:hypothetical protein
LRTPKQERNRPGLLYLVTTRNVARAAAIIAAIALSVPMGSKTTSNRVAVAVSNSLSVARTDKVDIDSPFDVEKIRGVVVSDGQSSVPAQLSGDQITIIARNIPPRAAGCTGSNPARIRPPRGHRARLPQSKTSFSASGSTREAALYPAYYVNHSSPSCCRKASKPERCNWRRQPARPTSS